MEMQISEIRKKIAPVVKKYPIAKLAVFGSYASGTANKKSDIDLLVEFDKKSKISLFDYSGIKLDFEERLGKKVDLVQYKNIKPLLKDYIIGSEKEIYVKKSKNIS